MPNSHLVLHKETLKHHFEKQDGTALSEMMSLTKVILIFLKSEINFSINQ